VQQDAEFLVLPLVQFPHDKGVLGPHVAIVLFYRYHLNKVAMQRERVIDTLWNIPREELPAEPEQPEKVPETEESQPSEPTVASRFLVRFKEVVEARMADSDVSVEDAYGNTSVCQNSIYLLLNLV